MTEKNIEQGSTPSTKLNRAGRRKLGIRKDNATMVLKQYWADQALERMTNKTLRNKAKQKRK